MKGLALRFASLASLGVALLTGGCMVGPNFKAPPAPQVQGYVHGKLSTTLSSADIAGGHSQHLQIGGDIPAQWWTLFHSPELNQLVTDALKNNATLAAAKASLREAHENYLASYGGLFPAFQAGFNAEREKSSGALFGNPAIGSNIFTLYNAKAQVSYSLDLFGGTRRQIEQSKAALTYQKFQLTGAWLTLTSNVATTVIQIASLRSQIRVNRQLTDAQRKIAAIIKRQIKVGAASQAQLQQQIAQLAQVEAQLAPLRKALAQQQNQLATLTGRFPSQLAPLKISLDQLRLPKNLPVSLPSKLIQQRPDIRAAQATLHQASAAIGVATANLFPQITLSASIGSVATKIGDLFSPGGGIWSLAGGLTQPLFNGGALLHKKRAAVAAYEQAAARYRGTVLTAFQNVSDSLRALSIDADALKAQVAAEQAARKSYAIAKRQLKLGGISYPALLQSELSYEQTRTALAQARAARYSDTVALFQALGGGWWHHATAAQPPEKNPAS